MGDVTYLRVGRQWRFLAVVLDQCSRRILAWRLARRRDSRLTCTVLNAAVRRRRPGAGVIFHSDRGSEYVAASFRTRVAGLGCSKARRSGGQETTRTWESFFHSMKAELIHGAHFGSESVLRDAVAGYVQYYNRRRLHSALGYCSPVDFETRAA